MASESSSIAPPFPIAPSKGLLKSPRVSVGARNAKRVRFRGTSYSICEMESPEDKVLDHEVKRKQLISLPRTIGMTVEANRLRESGQFVEAKKILQSLLTFSCLLSNSQRQSFFDLGGVEILQCSSKNPSRKLSPVGFFQATTSLLRSQSRDEVRKESCKCLQCEALSGDKNFQRQLGVCYSRGFLAEKNYKHAVEWWENCLPHKQAYVDLALFYKTRHAAQLPTDNEERSRSRSSSHSKIQDSKSRGNSIVESPEISQKKSHEYFLKAAELGHPLAQYEIGCWHLQKGTPKDVIRGLVFLENSADSGYGPAELELGELYSNGSLVEEDPYSAFGYYRRAAERGEVQAQWILGQAYEDGYGCGKTMEKAIYWYVKAAENNHAEAQRTLGYFFELGKTGEGVLDQDMSKALYWYDRAAAQKDAIAMYNLSNMYWKGKGVSKNLDQAIYWCTEAAEMGDLAAQVRVAEIHLDRGDPLLRDGDRVMYWLDMAANKGSAKAQYLMGKQFMEGIIRDMDIEEGMAWYHEAASKGYADAQYALAKLYRMGDIIESDDTLCFSWCSKAAKHGHGGAISMLARLYDTGKGCKQDRMKAIELYEEAVKKNDAVAQFYLGHIYQYGSNQVEQNLERAFELYLLASEQGEKRAQSNLGSMYKKGLGCAKDFVKAAYWYKKSAEQDHARGQANLGLLYENGLGVEKNYFEAAKWYYRAACKNNEKAQLRFALLCQQGLGVSQNDIEAVHWFEAAAAQGNALALFHLGRTYEVGRLAEQNISKAVKYYQDAAERKNPQARLRLAYMYEHGIGVPRDEALAYKYYEMAAEDDIVEAQVALALRFMTSNRRNSRLALQWFTKAANHDDISAMYVLAKQFQEQGQLDQAIYYYKKVAEKGNPSADRDLAMIYELRGDTDASMKYYRSAADAGDKEAQFDVFRLLYEKDPEHSISYLRRAAENGNSEAQYALGVLFSKGENISQDSVSAGYWFSLSAAVGNVDACFELGIAHLKGDGVVKSYKLAEHYLSEAAFKGNLNAMIKLAALKERSCDVTSDLVESYCWYNVAEQMGSKVASEKIKSLKTKYTALEDEFSHFQQQAWRNRNRAVLFGIESAKGSENDSFPSKNFRNSVLYHPRLIRVILEYMGKTFLIPEKGQISAYASLAEESVSDSDPCYLKGTSFIQNKDYIQALHWLEISAKGQNPEASFLLGNLYKLGLGTSSGKPDLDKALFNYQNAADLDYVPAARELAKFYDSTIGESRTDPLRSYCFWQQILEADFEASDAQEAITRLDTVFPNLKMDFKEIKAQAEEERLLAIFSGMSALGGKQSILYSKLRISPFFRFNILRRLKHLLGSSKLLVRDDGDDIFSFLSQSQLNISELEERASSGEVEAQFSMGNLYFEGNEGLDILVDFDKAGYWYGQAARQGHTKAMFKLASMFEKGTGFRKDLDRAMDLYEDAAKSGDVESCRYLGTLAKTGGFDSEDRDYLEAYCWFQMALEFGDTNSKAECEAIEAKEPGVREEFQELKGAAFAQRRLAFLSGLHNSSKSSLLYRYLNNDALLSGAESSSEVKSSPQNKQKITRVSKSSTSTSRTSKHRNHSDSLVKSKIPAVNSSTMSYLLKMEPRHENEYAIPQKLSQAGILRLILGFAGDGYLIVSPGMDLVDFLRIEQEDEKEKSNSGSKLNEANRTKETNVENPTPGIKQTGIQLQKIPSFHSDFDSRIENDRKSKVDDSKGCIIC